VKIAAQPGAGVAGASPHPLDQEVAPVWVPSVALAAGLLAKFHAGAVPRTFRVKNAGLLAGFHAGEAGRTFRAENAGLLGH